MSADSAGVKIPPPFIYIAGLLLGIFGGRLLPGRLPDGVALVVVSYVLLALGLLLGVSAIGLFRRAGTNVNPNQPVTSLVFDGPYRFTRNPMYLGLTCLYLAAALFARSMWACVLIIVVLLVIRFAVIAREERYLDIKFGDEYRSYRARVRRWL